MGLSDLLIAGALLAFAGYLLYHSLWKKKGHCHGCDCSSDSCDKH